MDLDQCQSVDGPHANLDDPVAVGGLGLHDVLAPLVDSATTRLHILIHGAAMTGRTR